MDVNYILPQEGSITAADCLRLLQAIQRGELDEFDLKNEINAQWRKGYRHGKQQSDNSVAELKNLVAELDKVRQELELKKIERKEN